jgi:hypothetical protein
MDMVNRPPHYTQHPSGIECIEVARVMGFVLGNAFKYAWRYRLKNNALEDINKALFYTEYYIEHMPPFAEYNYWERQRRRRLASAVPFGPVRRVETGGNLALIYLFDGWRLNSRELLLLAAEALQEVRVEVVRGRLAYETTRRSTASPTSGVHEGTGK